MPAAGSLLLYDSPSASSASFTSTHFQQLGLAYDAVTVRGNPAARAELVRAQGEPPQVPMLVDGDTAVWDRRRILAYLDRTYGAGEGPALESLPDWMGGSCSLEGEGAC